MKTTATKMTGSLAESRAILLKQLSRIVIKAAGPIFLSVAITVAAHAQDPILPPTNLGAANVFDGFAGEPGFVYQSFIQVFNTRAMFDRNGNKTSSDLKINSLVQTNQLIYLSPVEVLNGNVAFMVLAPIVKLSASGSGSLLPAVNPSVMGDPVLGVAVQWSDKRLFGKPFYHRAEIDASLPVGNFSTSYEINPSAHLWGYSVYHAFTLMVDKKISISARNQLNLNSDIIGTEVRPGAFYTGNYSVDYELVPKLRVEAVAYYLKQLQQDSYAGDHQFYQTTYQITNSKERVFGVGPGLAYFAPHGVLFEAKVLFETQATHRLAGTRSVLRITIPLGR